MVNHIFIESFVSLGSVVQGPQFIGQPYFDAQTGLYINNLLDLGRLGRPKSAVSESVSLLA